VPTATVTWIKEGSLPRVLAGMGVRCTVRVMAGVVASSPSSRSTMPKAVRSRQVTPATTIAFRRATMDRPRVGFSPSHSDDLGLPMHGRVRDRERHSRARSRQRSIDTLRERVPEVENLRTIVSFCRSISLAVTFSSEAVCRRSRAAWHRGQSRRRPLRQGAVLVVRPLWHKN
jgi:hypothetical protein